MKPIEISQLNRYIKTVLQNDPLLSQIAVVGEVSNLKYHSSGHVYFSLKDKNSTVRCFLPQSRAVSMDFLPEEGMAVVAYAYIYLYEKGGYYSLNITDLRPQGEGSLSAAFDKLKKKLEVEGLFDPKYKKPIPKFPKRVGICTADTGAAVWDIIRTIKNKNSVVDIVLCPCKVQGEGAAEDIAAALKALENMSEKPDVIIVGRGGGSMEDLWAFNEEKTARAIFGCSIPIISAVGHETDFTIADFAADFRAATPTAGAEASVANTIDLQTTIEFLLDEARALTERKIFSLETDVKNASPLTLLNNLQSRVELMEIRAGSIYKEAAAAFKSLIQSEEAKMERLMAGAESLNPHRLMELGYGAISDKNGRLIKAIDDLNVGDDINVRINNGEFCARVTQII